MIIYFNFKLGNTHWDLIKVIRNMLARENRRMDHEDLQSMNEAKRGRIEQAAKLKGISFAEALEKQRGFRYLL